MEDRNCPYCNPEDSWGGSPEMFEEIWQRHLQEHCEVCPTCGQRLKADKDFAIDSIYELAQ